MTMRVFLVSIMMVLLVGCGKPAEKPVAVKAPDKILATVNGEPIYNKDVKLALALRLQNSPNLKVTPDTLKEQIDLIIDERLSFQHKQRSNSQIKINLK